MKTIKQIQTQGQFFLLTLGIALLNVFCANAANNTGYSPNDVKYLQILQYPNYISIQNEPYMVFDTYMYDLTDQDDALKYLRLKVSETPNGVYTSVAEWSPSTGDVRYPYWYANPDIARNLKILINDPSYGVFEQFGAAVRVPGVNSTTNDYAYKVKVKWTIAPKYQGKKLYFKFDFEWIYDANYTNSTGITGSDVPYIPLLNAFVGSGLDKSTSPYSVTAGRILDFKLHSKDVLSTRTISWDSITSPFIVDLNNFNITANSKATTLLGSLRNYVFTDSQLPYDQKQTIQVQSISKSYSQLNSTQTIVNNGYVCPTSLTLSANKCDKSVTLSWSAKNNTSGNANVIYAIYRKKAGEANYTYLKSTINSTTLSIKDDSPTLEFGKLNTYLVRCIPAEWNVLPSDSRFLVSNAETFIPSTVTTNTVTISQTKPTFSLFNAKANPTPSAPSIYLSWAEEWCTTSKVDLIRKIGNVIDTIHISDGLNVAPPTYYEDKGVKNGIPAVQINNAYTYKLKVTQTGNNVVYSDTVRADLTKMMVFDDSKFKVSKGTMSDRISVSWAIDDALLCNEFVVERREYNATNIKDGTTGWREVRAMTCTKRTEIFDDMTIMNGIAYQYRVIGKYYVTTLGLTKTLTAQTNSSDNSIGFCQPTGNISGRISFKTGASVKDVEVIVDQLTNDSNSLMYRSLSFNGTDSQSGKVYFPKATHPCVANGFTFQCWVNPITRSSDSKAPIAELKDEFSVYLHNQTVAGKPLSVPVISLYLDPIGKTTPLIYARIDSIGNTDFFHITATYDRDSSLVKLFLDGKLKVRKLLTVAEKDKLICKNSGTDSAPFYIGTAFSATEKSRFNGKIDEVRVYNRPLQAKEVLSSYSRYISGEEKGLVGYWRMDEGITQFAFDCSSVNKVYNENHMTLAGVTSVVDDLAKRTQLSIKGVTNEDGNYIISGIPFVGDGMPFSVTPMFDAHSFEPTQRLRFIGTGSTVHNGTDFTDISSFKIGGTINYANTNVPVENVEIYIDGEAQIKEGKVVATDKDGKYFVDVPIGYHYLEFKKYGHNFTDAGRWPKTGKEIFDESSYKRVEQHNVMDSTLTVLAGRVVGGNIQSSKQLGAKSSVANIGQSAITLKLKTTSSALSLNKTASTLTQQSSYKAISSTSTIGTGKQEITITTDPETGEFYTKLPPLSYEIKSINTNNNKYTKTHFKDIVDVVDLDAIVPVKETWNDTIWINKALNKIDKVTPNEISFNVRFDAIYQAPTTLELYPLKFKQDQTVYVAEAFGDSLMSVRPDPAIEKYDTIPAYSKTNGTINYKVVAQIGSPLPIFQSGNAYGIRVKAYESYTPPTAKANDPNFIKDYCTIPKSGATFSVNNGLAANQLNIQTKETTPNQTDGLKLAEDGTYDLWFITGFPDYNGKPMKFIVILDDNATNNKEVDFKEAYMTGMLPTDGSDFMTTTPLPLTVLRDPPGSNSYAYYEAGSELENANTISSSVKSGMEMTRKISLGASITTIIGMTVSATAEVKNTTKNTLKGALEWNSNTKMSKKVALTERISTSASPDMVGRDADVFIGTGMNVYKTPSIESSLYYDKTDKLYKIKNIVSEPLTLESATTFYYPRKHIVNTLLPQLRKQLEGLLKKVNVDQYNTSYPKLADAYQYITTLESDAVNLGEEKTYIEIPPSNPAKEQSNPVKDRLTDINMWKQWLKDDEQFALVAKDGKNVNYKTENISYASGATIEKTYTITATKQHNSDFKASLDWNTKVQGGVTYNKVGYEIAVSKSIGGSAGYSVDVNSANHTTYGYVLQDDNLSDYMALDVCMPTNTTLKDNVSTDFDQQAKIDVQLVNGSPLFFLKGGISQCPHEGSTKTQYYNPGTKINDGTLAIDVPNLYIDANNSQFINVPAGKSANVVIEMSNSTLTNVQSMFTLTYDVQKSKGALVTMDGVSLMDGKSFLLSKDQVLKKTIQIRQTQADVLNYDSIDLILSPACGGAIADVERIRVSFMPTCSDLTLAIDERLNNTLTSDTLRYKIKDFDIRYDGLQEIQFQSSVNGGLTWSLARKYSGFNTSNSTLLRNDVSVPGLFVNGILSDMLIMPTEDGDYYYRARSKCKKGNDEYFVESEPIKIVKDQYRPRVMAFSPNNGILTPENEFSVLFNEDLNTGVIKPAIYKLTAILNDSITKGGIRLKTNGTGATTDSPIYLNNSSFTIQGWFKYSAANNGSLLKLGDGENQVSLSYRSQDKKLIVKTGLTDVSEITIISPTTWEFLSLSYNVDTKELSLSRVGSGAENKELLRKSVLNVSPQGRLTLGGSLQAEVYNVSIWSKAIIYSDVYANKDLSFSGKEIGLLAYWPMGEGKGTVTVDRVSGRSLLLNESAWGFTFDNRALSVNASNKFAAPFGETVFMKEQDFSIEFWMKGANQVNTTLLSLGDGVLDYDVNGKFSLSFDATGQLQLLNSKQAIPLTTGTITDDAWHHLALTVTRSGVSKLYVDGTLKSYFNSSNLGQISGSNLRLGGRRYNKVSTNLLVEDRNWIGQFDEFRVWKTALTPEFIRDMCNTKVKGNEIGLVLYYPFEKYTRDNSGNLLFENTADNMVIGSTQKGISTGTYTSAAPGMRDASLVSELNKVAGIVSSNKIVFDLSGYGMNRIEGTTIHLWVDNKGIEDKNRNLMQNPIEKSIYVDMNRLNWESQLPVNINKEIMATTSFKAIIVNASSKIENYVINGMPEWLDCSNFTGQLNPLERKELTFNVNPAVNIGSYETLLSLVGNNNIEERLPVTLNVTGQRPNWTVNPALYTGSMSVTGQLLISGLIQEDENDLIAVFRGTTCVGITSPKYLKSSNKYLVFLDVYGEATNNNTALTFNIWDASTGRVYPNVNVVGGAVKYQDGGIVATFNNPKVFDATNKIEQTMTLNTGWNWVSTYVKTTPTDLFSQFTNSIGNAGVEIKNSDLFKNYYSDYNSWFGSLESISATSLYLVKASKPANVLLVGEMTNPSTELISIIQNWNWIGYTPNFVMPTATALLGLNAQVNDLIKGQSGYAIYTGTTTGWLGSLAFMQPGQGYMYYSNSSSSKQFSYPAKYVGQKNVRALSKNNTNLYYSFDKSLYQMNMSVDIEATMDGNPINNDKFEVAAFNGNVCRGSIALKQEPSVNKYIGYLMLYGDQTDNFTFKGYDGNNSKTYVSEDNISYVPNGRLGSPFVPIKVRFTSSITTDQSDLVNGQKAIYPNPVINTLNFGYNPQGIERLEVVDCTGRTQVLSTAVTTNSINVSDLIPGIYTLRVNYMGTIRSHRFIKK